MDTEAAVLFGRGVRLKGKDWTLRRSTGPASAEGAENVPSGLEHLETLYISGQVLAGASTRPGG